MKTQTSKLTNEITQSCDINSELLAMLVYSHSLARHTSPESIE